MCFYFLRFNENKQKRRKILNYDGCVCESKWRGVDGDEKITESEWQNFSMGQSALAIELPAIVEGTEQTLWNQPQRSSPREPLCMDCKSCQDSGKTYWDGQSIIWHYKLSSEVYPHELPCQFQPFNLIMKLIPLILSDMGMQLGASSPVICRVMSC